MDDYDLPSSLEMPDRKCTRCKKVQRASTFFTRLDGTKIYGNASKLCLECRSKMRDVFKALNEKRSQEAKLERAKKEQAQGKKGNRKAMHPFDRLIYLAQQAQYFRDRAYTTGLKSVEGRKSWGIYMQRTKDINAWKVFLEQTWRLR